MTFESLGETLDRSLPRGPIGGVILALKVEKATEKNFPPNLKAEMTSYRKGRLSVSVPSATHAQEVFLQSREMLRKINEELGRKVVKEIRFRIARN